MNESIALTSELKDIFAFGLSLCSELGIYREIENKPLVGSDRAYKGLSYQ
jgi:hypothetical protein